MTSHRLMSIETVAVVNETDETDEYSLSDCTFPSAQRKESYKDASISYELVRTNLRGRITYRTVSGCTDKFT